MCHSFSVDRFMFHEMFSVDNNVSQYRTKTIFFAIRKSSLWKKNSLNKLNVKYVIKLTG